MRERLACNKNYEIADSIISRLYEMCKGINITGKDKRNIRIERAFGEEYSLKRIEYRILYTNPEKEIYPKPQTWNTKLKYKGTLKTKPKAKGLKALYLYYCYLLKVFPKKNMQHKLTPEMREAVKKMDEYSEQTRLLCKYNITTISELNTCKNDFKRELQELINERKNCVTQEINCLKIKIKRKY